MNTTHREASSARRERLQAPQVAQIDLSEERRRVRQQPTWEEHGHAALTLYKYPDIRAVLIGMKPGSHIPSHQTDGRIVLQLLAGRVRVHALEQAVELTTGRMLTLEHGVPHQLEALEEADLLLTVALAKPVSASDAHE